MLIKLIFIYILTLTNLCAQPEIVVWQKIKNFDYMTRVVNAALEITEKEYGKVNITPSPNYSQAEVVENMLHQKTVHLAVFPPNSKRLKGLIPIDIPFTRGLLGMRVCVINSSDKKLFEKVKTIEDFRNLGIRVVAHRDWVDNEFYSFNNIEVLHGSNHRELYNLTKKSKKVCFSRSLSEIDSELGIYNFFGLEVEKNLLFTIDFPSLLFVSKNKPELAKRLTVGMKRIIEDKTFFKIFWNKYAKTFDNLKVQKRSIIHIKTPYQYVSKRVLSDPMLWLPARIERNKKASDN